MARLDVARSSITARASGDVDILLALSTSVPFRVFTLAEPFRLILDFREVDFGDVQRKDLIRTSRISAMRRGIFRPGWTRMVLEMAEPLAVYRAKLDTGSDGTPAMLSIRLTPQDEAEFIRSAGASSDDFWALPRPIEVAPKKRRFMGDRKLVVALDPGHGGVDPGARYKGVSEAGLMLKMAREVKELLSLSGRFKAFLTRREDVFMSLEERVSHARANGADIFLSLHADALTEGMASGTTVYTLSEIATNRAAELLARSHERSDLLAGVDLSGQDDLIASILMDMARIETAPRSQKLAGALVAGIAKEVGKQRPRPPLSAGFSVLKAPDIPSVLIEFGFMSNPRDLALLSDQNWRQKVARGMIRALDAWSIEDAAQARLLRK